LNDCVAGKDEVLIGTRKEIKLWQWRKDKVRAIRYPEEALGDESVKELYCNAMTASPDGKRLLLSFNQTQPALKGTPVSSIKLLTQLRLLDRATGKVLHRFETSKSLFDCWRFGPDGKSVLSTQWDGSIWLLMPPQEEEKAKK
jgi:WD40 repeat protein